ncbi:O-glucosyltransferase rumi-like protein (DUF821) [Rhynchospora pubera]|uniref:O-glucosyltransferase rumi-like protein (DUF821) n=1 Tax=Rhynchospora pubera TaxID=906938 RepID=A0AAV8DWD4_9POAL|nr:O-glucosyltransferase rumi-like protein (DUF821) [Rhynchospora pubera]
MRKDKVQTATLIVQFPIKEVFIFVIGLIVLTVLIYSTWSDDISSAIGNVRGSTGLVRMNRQPSRIPATPIILSCPTDTAITCNQTPNNASSTTPLPSASQNTKAKHNSFASPSCPDFFRYIHEDLKPWKSTGITKEMVDSARQFAHFRLVIINGKAYHEQYKKCFQTRDLFTIWGILQLLNRYPSRVPDLELMFNCEDPPMIKKSNYNSSAPPLFHYCKDESALDILFPDWTFWGWPEVNIKPWDLLLDELKNTTESLEWKDKIPYAFWKGNPSGIGAREDLMRCNLSSEHEWNARLFRQDWRRETANGFTDSNLAKQCNYRYKIYIDGMSWSVSEKYILACKSPMLLVTTRYIDFYTRGLLPGKHYWPINSSHKCESIKFAVDWGNTHLKEAEDLGTRGSLFARQELSMENTYDYMLHLLTEYAQLLTYKPTPDKANHICIESMACPATGLWKQFMLDSMVKSTYEFEPCSLSPPFDIEDLNAVARSKEEYLEDIEKMEKGTAL